MKRVLLGSQIRVLSMDKDGPAASNLFRLQEIESLSEVGSDGAARVKRNV